MSVVSLHDICGNIGCELDLRLGRRAGGTATMTMTLALHVLIFNTL